MGRTACVMALAVVVLSACYVRRHIIVPPTEHGVFCMKDADMSWQLCMMQQRGVVICDQRKDQELLRCEGAYEMAAAGDAGVAETTYGLPGFRP